MKNTYEGNVEITKENQAEWSVKLAQVTKVIGEVSMYGNAQRPVAG